MSYNPWPIGGLPDGFVRPEIEWARINGFWNDDPREIVNSFENEVAAYCGSKYAVSVDCCSHGIFLALKMRDIIGNLEIPKHTYVSVPMQVIHAGSKPIFTDEEWCGFYEIGSTQIFDSAPRFTSNMYLGNGAIQVLSFQIKKRLPIGRGGMILTDSKEERDWLISARYDGRDLHSKYNSAQHVSRVGWHFYMTPEDAARGLQLLHQLPMNNEDVTSWENYPDVSLWDIWK
jgi:dTDP-4-amino-4,6-dideoxygalactose transaminase